MVYPLREPPLSQFEDDDDEEEEDEESGVKASKRKKNKAKADQKSSVDDLKSAEVEYLRLCKSKAFGPHK